MPFYADEELKQENINLEPKTSSFISDDELLSNGINLNNNSSFKPVQNSTSLQHPVTTQQPTANQSVLNNTQQNPPVMYSAPSFDYKKWVSERPTNNIFANAGKDAAEIVGGLAQLLGQGAVGLGNFAASTIPDIGSLGKLATSVGTNTLTGNLNEIPNNYNMYLNELKEHHPNIISFGNSLKNDLKNRELNSQKFYNGELTYPQFLEAQRLSARENHPELLALKDALVQGIKEQYGQGERDISKEGIDLGKLGQSFLQHPLMNGLDVIGVGEIGKIDKISDAIRAAETMKNIKAGASQAAKRQGKINERVAELKANGEKVPSNIAEQFQDVVHYDDKGNKYRLDINGNKQYFDKPTENLVLKPIDYVLQSERVQKFIQNLDKNPVASSTMNFAGTFLGAKENNPLLGQVASARTKLRRLEKERKAKTNQELIDAERKNNQNFGNLTDEQGKDIIKDIEGKTEATNPNIKIPDTNITENSENALKGEVVKNTAQAQNEIPNIPNSKNVTSDAESLKGQVTKDNVAQTGNIINKTNADGIVEINGKYYWDNAKGEMPDNIAPEKMNGVIIDGKSYVEIGDVPKDLKQVEQPFEAITDDVKNVAKTEESKVQPVDLDKLEEVNKDYKGNPKFEEIDNEFKNADNNVQSVKTEENTVLDNSVPKEDLTPVNDVPSVRTKEDIQNEIAQINQELKDARKKGMTKQARKEFIHEKNARLKELKNELNKQSKNNDVRYKYSKEEISKLMEDLQKGKITPEQFEQKISNLPKTKKEPILSNNKKDIVSDEAKNTLETNKEIFENGISDADYEFFNEGRRLRDSNLKHDKIEFVRLLRNSSIGKHPFVKNLLDNFDDSTIIKTIENTKYDDGYKTHSIINSKGNIFVRRKYSNGKNYKRGDIFSNIIHELQHKYNTIKGENLFDNYGKTSDEYMQVIKSIDDALKNQKPTIDKNGNKCYNINGKTYTEKELNNSKIDCINRYDEHPDEITATNAEKAFKQLYNNAKKEFVSKRNDEVYNARRTSTTNKNNRRNNNRNTRERKGKTSKRGQNNTSLPGNKERVRYKYSEQDANAINALFDAKNKLKSKLKANSDYYKSIGKLSDETENRNIIDTFAAYKNGISKRDKITDSMREEALKIINSLPEDKRPFYVPRMYDEHLTKADFGLGHYRQLDDIDELKHRSYTGDADKIKNGKLTRSFNIEKIANRLDEHRIKLDNMAKYLDDIKDAFAKPLNSLEEIKDGYVPYDPELIKDVFFGKTKLADATINGLKENRSLEASLKNALTENADAMKLEIDGLVKNIGDKNRSIYQIPKKIYEDLVNSFNYEPKNEVAKFALNAWDISDAMFKKNVLGLNPKWFVNNRIGNIIMAAFKGTNLLNPTLIKKVSELSDDLFPAEIIGNTFHNAEKFGKLKSTGWKGLDNVLSLLDGNSVNDSKVLSALSLPGKVVNKISKTVFNFNQKFEIMDRKIAYLKGLESKKKEILKATGKKMMTYEELLKYAKNNPEVKTDVLLKHVDETLGDYSSLSHTERSIIRRVVPFYTWLRTITRHTLSLPKTNPIRTSIMSKVSAFSHEERDDLPNYQKNAVETGYLSDKDNKEIMLNMQHSVPQSTFGELGENPISMLNPKIQIPLEAIFGKKLYNGMPLTSKRYEKTEGNNTSYKDLETGKTVDNLPLGERVKYFGVNMARTHIPVLKQPERVVGGLLSDNHTPYDKLWDTDFGGYMEEDVGKRKGWSIPEQVAKTFLPIQKKGKPYTPQNRATKREKAHKRMLKK